MQNLHKNVVIVGKGFQPTVISETWLIKNQVFLEHQIHGNRVCTEMVSVYNTTNGDLSVLPEKLTFMLKDIAVHKDVVRSLSALVTVFPAISFTAVGLNCAWDITPANAKVTESLAKFVKFEKPLPAAIVAPALGFISSSQSIHGSQLRLSVLPAMDEPKSPPVFSKILAEFNFNFDIDRDGDQREQLKASIAHFDEAINTANEISAKFTQELQ